MAVYRSSSKGNTGGLTAVDDGTNYDFAIGSTKLWSVRKSDQQLLLAAGVTTDQTL